MTLIGILTTLAGGEGRDSLPCPNDVTENQQWQATPELCVMEISRIPFPGSRISAAYFFKNKFKALNKNTEKYTMTRKDYFNFLA
jgi:hypothetical protein